MMRRRCRYTRCRNVDAYLSNSTFFGHSHKGLEDSGEWRMVQKPVLCSLFSSSVQWGLSHESPKAFHSSQYVAAKLIWKIRDAISVGGEFLYGRHVQNNRADAEAKRLQFSIQY